MVAVREAHLHSHYEHGPVLDDAALEPLAVVLTLDP